MVGTKIDLENDRVVTKDEAEQYAKGLGLKYVETSAATDTGVLECFSLIFEAGILVKNY
jgi:GTPase SAR1 family protein